jgi:methylthioribulose-1-phosphate dehydratase
MVRLSQRVETVLQEHPGTHGFLLRGHGLYTWGDDIAQARRHIEIFEFLLETTGRMKAMGGHGADQHS